MKAKTDRNKRLYNYWKSHPDMSYQAIANLFRISKERGWHIIKEAEKAKEQKHLGGLR